MEKTHSDRISDELIVRYLLGQLSFEEEEAIDLAMADDEFFHRVSAIEEDLIDDYAEDRLPMPVRDLVGQRLLNTQRQQKQLASSRAFYEAARQARIEEQALKVVEQFASMPQSATQITDEHLTRYLLGRLSFEEEAAIDLALVDDNFFSRVTAIEEDLIDEYARGKLIGEEQRLVEQQLLKTARQRGRLAGSRALFAAAKSISEPKAVEGATAADQVARIARDAGTPVSGSWRQRLTDLFRIPFPALASGLALGVLALFAGGAWVIDELRSRSDEISRLRGREQELSRQNQEQSRQNRDLPTGNLQRSDEISRLRRREQELLRQNEDMTALNRLKEEQLKRTNEDNIELRAQLRENIGKSSRHPTNGEIIPGSSIAQAEGVIPKERNEPAIRVNEQKIDDPIKLTLKKGNTLACLKLHAPDKTNSEYLLLLTNAKQELPILQIDGLKPVTNAENSQLELIFPANLLSPGKYRLKVSDKRSNLTWVFDLTVE
jgi:hypothetical protein